MAIVPRVQRSVAPRPLSGQRATAAETAESQGAGLAGAQADALGASARFFAGVATLTGNEAATIASEERERANKTAVLAGDNALATWEAEQMSNLPRGQAAMGLPEKLRAEFEKRAGVIEAGLNDEQRDVFAEIRQRRGQNLDLAARRHTLGELRQIEANEYKAGIDNNLNAAVVHYDDKPRIAQELAQGMQRIKDRAALLGQGPEATKNELDGFTSSTHAGIIKAYVNADRAAEARAYFDGVKADLNDGQLKSDLQTMVTKAGTRKEAQTRADAITAEGGSESEQLEKAKAIENVDVREIVEDKIRQNVAVQARKVRERDEDNTHLAFNIINKTNGDLTSPGFGLLLDSLPPSAQSAVRGYADHVARNVDVETDQRTKFDLWEQAGKDPEAFATRSLWEVRNKLSRSDFEEVQRLQLAYRQKDTKAADSLIKGFRTKAELLDSTLREYGIDPAAKSKAVKDSIAVVMDMLDKRVEAAGGTDKVSNADMQKMLDDILTRSAKVPGSLYGTNTKRLIDLTVKDTAVHRTRIERILGNAGRPVSDATVLSFDREIRMRFGDDWSASGVDRIPERDRKDVEAALKALGKPSDGQTVLDTYLEILARKGLR